MAVLKAILIVITSILIGTIVLDDIETKGRFFSLGVYIVLLLYLIYLILS